jgi:hypothetical protein
MTFFYYLFEKNAGIKIEQNIKAQEVNEIKLEEIEEDLSEYAHKGILKIGVPKEIFPGEKRVSIVPSTIRKLVKCPPFNFSHISYYF